jgi:hypothetical protein
MTEFDAVATLLFYLCLAVLAFFGARVATRILLNKMFAGWMLVLLRPNKPASVFNFEKPRHPNENQDPRT